MVSHVRQALRPVLFLRSAAFSDAASSWPSARSGGRDFASGVTSTFASAARRSISSANSRSRSAKRAVDLGGFRRPVRPAGSRPTPSPARRFRRPLAMACAQILLEPGDGCPARLSSAAVSPSRSERPMALLSSRIAVSRARSEVRLSALLRCRAARARAGRVLRQARRRGCGLRPALRLRAYRAGCGIRAPRSASAAKRCSAISPSCSVWRVNSPSALVDHSAQRSDLLFAGLAEFVEPVKPGDHVLRAGHARCARRCRCCW